VDVARNLDVVVTAVATQLMAADAATAAETSQRILAELVDHFDVDLSFLRHNDLKKRTTNLVAEWPVRPDIPDPDPLGVISFEHADPVFALLEHTKEPVIIRPDPTTDEYGQTIERGHGVPVTSLAAVPMVSGELTTGAIGFIKFDDREWTQPELNALLAIAALFAQLQARIRFEDELRYLAEHDDLTGFYSRRTTIALLESVLAGHERRTVPVLVVDMDRLKLINDHLGHEGGDQFLQTVSDRLRATAGDAWMIGRFGGDEFVIFPTESADTTDALDLAERLRTAVREPIAVGAEHVRRSASVGVAAGRQGSDNAVGLIGRAGEAMEHAKRAGGNTTRMFTASMSAQTALRNDVELHLRNAIENDELTLHYLPEFDLRTRKILALEALVRWHHPTRGLLYPDSFIGVAEQINLAGELGRWVLRRACADFARWRSQGLARDVLLRVNTSPIQVVSANFAESVAEVLADHDLDPGILCLEITETVVVDDIELTRANLRALRDMGVTSAIDDFGIGHSVLSHLKSLPVDTIKIDKSFVFDLGVNAEDLAIVRSTIGLAEAFRLEVVAEGVESETAVSELLKYGCYRAQGFLLSRPVPGDTAATLLARQ
jgi:diguanylate cyclase (GGDEF)-like protein